MLQQEWKMLFRKETAGAFRAMSLTFKVEKIPWDLVPATDMSLPLQIQNCSLCHHFSAFRDRDFKNFIVGIRVVNIFIDI